MGIDGKLEPSVIYREGRLTRRDYDEAIEFLREARGQLDEEGFPVKGYYCPCGGDCGTNYCHHNPLLMARIAVKPYWRCFHCGERFTDENEAREHFGKDETEPARCEAES